MARYGTGLAVVRMTGAQGFPLGVIAVNVVGSFLMGLFAVAALERGLGQWSPFVMTGILGGFTTFSAFSLEAVTLWERGATGQAGAYVVLSLVGAIGGLVLGLWLGRAAWA